MDVVLAIDLSGSMAGSVDQVRSAASDLVDALRGAPNRVAVVTFADSAEVEVALTDVGDDGGRDDVKDAIDDLGVGGLFGIGGGGTNWQSGLRAAADLSPELVVMISDGEPNGYSPPAVTGLEAAPEYSANPALGAAVTVANELRDSNVRVVAIGVGTVNTVNLAEVSGPTEGDDYFTTDTTGLLRQLYEIASRACDIPVEALPQPLAGSFPLAKVLGAALGALALLVLVGMLLSRRRDGPGATSDRGPRQSRRKIPVARIEPLPPVLPPAPSHEPVRVETSRDLRAPAHDDEVLPETEVRWVTPDSEKDVHPAGTATGTATGPDAGPDAGTDDGTDDGTGDGAAEGWGVGPVAPAAPGAAPTTSGTPQSPSPRRVRRISTDHLFGDESPGR